MRSESVLFRYFLHYLLFFYKYYLLALYNFRCWLPSSAGAAVFFVSYEILIEVDNRFSTNPLCPYTHREYPSWYWFINYCVCGGFLITSTMLALKICFSHGDQKVPYMATFCICFMATIATLLSLIWDWGGTCVDLFGYDLMYII